MNICKSKDEGISSSSRTFAERGCVNEQWHQLSTNCAVNRSTSRTLTLPKARRLNSGNFKFRVPIRRPNAGRRSFNFRITRGGGQAACPPGDRYLLSSARRR
mmetsp:Transcript_67443/g.180198  ORF Transcript_67443/g.180198 Transcript_67443/m.180198 type:complete len:102 (+) Transcript_67443:1918-2223(+)